MCGRPQPGHESLSFLSVKCLLSYATFYRHKRSSLKKFDDIFSHVGSARSSTWVELGLKMYIFGSGPLPKFVFLAIADSRIHHVTS